MPDLLYSALEPYQSPSKLSDEPLEQFKRLGKIAAWLASDEPNEQSLKQTLNVFTKFLTTVDSTTLAAEFELNRIQIVRYSDRFGYQDFYADQRKLDRSMREHHHLLESMHGSTDQSASNTFFLSELADACFLEADEYNAQVDGTKRLLEEVLSSISDRALLDQPRRTGGALASLSRFGHGLFSRSNFDALAAIHHEIAENALSHGTYSRLNDRSWPNTNSAFGNTFHLQVRSFPYTKSNRSRVDSLHPQFSKHTQERNDSAANTYWMFSYCDTGGGILNHVSEFGGVEPGLKIQNLIEEKISTRSFSGSGYGLDKICKFANQLGAFVFIETKGTSFCYDGLLDVMDEGPQRVDRGTMICIVISSSVQHAVRSS